MKQCFQEALLKVCIVAQNPLAGKYLVQVLQKDLGVRAIFPEDLVSAREAPLNSLVFLLDLCELTSPVAPLVRGIASCFPGAGFVGLGQEQPEDDLARLLLSGLQGYVAHPEIEASLLKALWYVSKGHMWIPRDALRAYVQYISPKFSNHSPARDTMTPRENEILELVKRRFSNREIGEILNIRESTVKFHLSNVFLKRHITNRRDLFARTEGGTACIKWLVPFLTTMR
jgi:DNA-binding NarL/FixJ family response regulator